MIQPSLLGTIRMHAPEVMQVTHATEWMEEFFKEYQGMMDRGAVNAVKPPPGAKILEV